VKANVTGDMSDSFSFASFFPEPLQPAATVVSNITYNILKVCNCCGNSQQTTGAYSVDSNDSERRKARALRALDQRIQMQDYYSNQSTQADVSPSSGRDIPEV